MMILQTTRGALSSGGFDRLAARYIGAVESAGASVSADQKTAIDSFFKQGKTDGWFSSMRRIYLPIWGLVAPNAIDMISNISGLFSGGVTHGSGFVKGNGTSGTFRSDASASGVGRSESTGIDFVLIKSAPTIAGWFCGGTSNSFTRRCGLQSTAVGVTGYSNTNTTAGGFTLARSSQVGIIASSRTANNLFDFYHRTSSGFSKVRTVTTTETVAAPTTLWRALSRTEDVSTVSSSWIDAEMGAYGFGLGLNETQTDNFTLAVKTLWETCTGLTLP